MDGDGDVTVSFGKREIKFNPECLRPAEGSVFDEKDEEPQGKQKEAREKQQGRQDRSSTDVDSVPSRPDLSRQEDEPQNRGHTNRVSPTPGREPSPVPRSSPGPPVTQPFSKDGSYSPTEDEESEEGMDDISGTFLSSFMYLKNGIPSLHKPEKISQLLIE